MMLIISLSTLQRPSKLTWDFVALTALTVNQVGYSLGVWFVKPEVQYQRRYDNSASGSTSPPLNLSFFVAFGGVIT